MTMKQFKPETRRMWELQSKGAWVKWNAILPLYAHCYKLSSAICGHFWPWFRPPFLSVRRVDILPLGWGFLGGSWEDSKQPQHSSDSKHPQKDRSVLKICQLPSMQGLKQAFPQQNISAWLDACCKDSSSLGLQISPTTLWYLCIEKTLCPSDVFIQRNDALDRSLSKNSVVQCSSA